MKIAVLRGKFSGLKIVAIFCRFFLLFICLNFMRCNSGKVTNLKTTINSQQNQLKLDFDLTGSKKTKYDVKISLVDDKLNSYLLGLNEISPKPINVFPSNGMSYNITTNSEILKQKYFLVKLRSSKRKNALTIEEKIFIQKDSIKPFEGQFEDPIARKIQSNIKILNLGVLPISNFGVINDPTLNLTFSHLYEKNGFYLSIKGTTNNVTNAFLETNNSYVISPPLANTYYSFTNKINSNRYSITIGGLHRIARNLIGTYGLGYGVRNLYYEVQETSYGIIKTSALKHAKNLDQSYSGAEFEAGILFVSEKFNVNFSGSLLGITNNSNLTNGVYADFTVGIGFNFR